MGFKPFQLGKYYFEELLGRGGMAEVYRVTARGAGSFQKQFAVKRIIAGALDNEEAVRRFKEEAHFNSKMSHPNVVQVFDFVEADGTYLLVMEYVHGPDLAAILGRFHKRGQAVPPAFAAFVALMTCHGLDHAYHSVPPDSDTPLRIVHRDVSPQNIMIAYDGHVKLVDFGIAKATRGPLTQVGLVRGKMQYFSPEQAAASHVDHRSDIFSVALVLLEMLLGQTPYRGETDTELVAQAQARDIPDFSETNPLIPLGLYPILEKALRFEPAERYQRADEMAQELKHFLEAIAPDYGQQSLADKLGSLFEKEKRKANAPSSRNMPLSTKEELGLVEGLEGFERALGLPPENEFEFTNVGTRGEKVELQMRINRRLSGLSRVARTSGFRRWAKRAGVAGTLLLLVVVAGVARNRRRGNRLPAETPACRLAIASTPPKARAIVNDTVAGETPVTVNVPCGTSVRLTLQRSGFKTYAGKVTIEEAQGSVRVKLEKKGRR